MNDQAYQDDGAIPPPPPPPMQDDGSGFSAYTGQQGQGQAAADPYGQQATGQQYSGGQQYDPNFAHAPYDPNQAQAQQYADPYAQPQYQQDFGQQPVAQQGQQGGYYDDPFAAQAQGAAGQNAGQGAFDPMMGPPMGGGDDGTAPPGAPPAPPKPSKPANFQLGTKLNRALKVKLPAHNLQFDESYFLSLLAGSISLSKDEKLRIIESMPKLRQSQVDELIRIFEEEKQKFAELGEEHVAQLDKLAAQHYEDWVDIEMKQEQSSKANDDEAQAEAIRKSLGI